MAITADDIVRSEAWTTALKSARDRLWVEFSLCPTEDVDTLRRLKLCLWALNKIESELVARMRATDSPNLRVAK